MENYISTAKTLFGNKWVCGYYVAVPWDFGNEVAHIIIEPTAEYKSGGEFAWNHVHRVHEDTVRLYTGMSEFVMADKSICAPLFAGDIVEVHSVRRPYAGYQQSQYDGRVKARAVIYFDRGTWKLDYKNAYNANICNPRGNEQCERTIDNSWELYYFGYHGRDEDKYREMNKRSHYHDIVKIGNIYDNPELLEG